MARKKEHSGPGRLLTELELELMSIIWSRGEATVKEVAADLAASRDLAYTSVATMMKILEQKEYLRCQKDAHAHRFVPLVSKTVYEGTCLDHMVKNVFDGEPVALVQRLLNAKQLSKDELQAIERAVKDLAAPEKRRPEP